MGTGKVCVKKRRNSGLQQGDSRQRRHRMNLQAKERRYQTPLEGRQRPAPVRVELARKLLNRPLERLHVLILVHIQDGFW